MPKLLSNVYLHTCAYNIHICEYMHMRISMEKILRREYDYQLPLVRPSSYQLTSAILILAF